MTLNISNPYNYILSDLGGVIVSFSHLKMIDNLSELSGITRQELTSLFLHENSLGFKVESGKISEQSAYKVLRDQSAHDFSFSQMQTAISDIFSLNRTMLSWLETQKQKNRVLGLLSNTIPSHFQWIMKMYPLDQLFDYLFLSFELNLRKPDKKIFTYCLNQMQCKASDCLFIDDLENNISAAKSLGFNTLLYNRINTSS